MNEEGSSRLYPLFNLSLPSFISLHPPKAKSIHSPAYLRFNIKGERKAYLRYNANGERRSDRRNMNAYFDDR